MLLPVAAALRHCKQSRCCHLQPRPPLVCSLCCICCAAVLRVCNAAVGYQLKLVPTWSNTSEVEATTLRPKAPKRLPMVLTR